MQNKRMGECGFTFSRIFLRFFLNPCSENLKYYVYSSRREVDYVKKKRDIISEMILESLIKEYEEIPSREELEKMYTFSEKHEENMKKLFDSISKK